MEEISGYSLYERLLESMSIICSFGVKDNYTDELIKDNWIKLQKQYPYLYDFRSITDKGYNFQDNIPIKFECQNKNSIEVCLDEIKNFIGIEIVKNKNLIQNKSLLAYSKITIKDIKYTFFSIYTPHLRTDFKSLSYIVTSFLNSFDNISTYYPMKSLYPTIEREKLIPDINEREEIINKKFNFRQVLKFNFKQLKENVQLTNEEKISCKNNIDNNEPIFISKTIKLNKEEMNKIISFCKEHGLSIQALLYASYLKASLELFQSNINEKNTDAINFQITFDQRKYSTENKKCIGLFSEAAYVHYPLDFINKTIVEISKEITKFIKTVTTLDSEEFKRFRIECYYLHKKPCPIPLSLTATNIGNFKLLDDLSDNIKEKFVDYYFMGGIRFPLPKDKSDLNIHMFSLFDGSCNMSLSYPQHTIPAINIIKLLNKIKENMLSLN